MGAWSVGNELRRVGYRSFLGLLWQLYLVNRNCRKHDFKTDIQIRFPIRWT